MDFSTLTDKCRLRRFSEVLGQRGLVEALLGKLEGGTDKLLPHLLFTGRDGVGKRSIARLYAQTLLCVEAEEGAPCQSCRICKAVLVGSGFDYVEMSARKFEDEQYFRQRVKQAKGGLSTASWRVFVIEDAECIKASSADVILKTLELQLDTSFIFLVNDVARFARALRSRCHAFRISPVDYEELFSRLKAVCDRESIVHEERALSTIALAAGGRVGEAFAKLIEVASLGHVTLARVRQAFNLEWEAAMIDCWQAQFRGEVDEALSHFERVAADGEGRVRIMQSFVLGMHFRFSVGRLPLGASPLLERLEDEAWAPIMKGWEELSLQRSRSVDLLIEDAMKFWGGVSRRVPSRAAFLRGNELLFGS